MNTEQPDSSLAPDAFDYYPSIAKAALIAGLERFGTQLTWRLDDALRTCPALSLIRDKLSEAFEDGPGLCELEARWLVPLAPDAVQSWPAWYVRLPDSWAADVPRLAAQTELQPYLMRDENDAWHIAQRMAIVCEHGEAGWVGEARRVEVEDTDVLWTLRRGTTSGAVLVLYESAGRIDVTAYPLDDSLVCTLQAGDGASCRDPLFDLSLQEVQRMTRELEDGYMPRCPENLVRLPVVCLAQTAEDAQAEACMQRLEARLREHWPRVSCTLHDDGAIGPLDAVVDWWPEGWPKEAGPWLRLTLPGWLHAHFAEDGLQMGVEHVAAEHHSPDTVTVTLASGDYLYVAELRLDDEAVRSAVQDVSDAGQCRLALVNLRNGRPLVLNLPWRPAEAVGAASAAAGALADDVRVARDHDHVHRQALALSARVRAPVRLHRCVVRAVA